MARTSYTRTLTRETAATLVAEGRAPHTLTVDQIYEVIRQGSRTTINDELKLWKAERIQADALASTLPPAIAESMRSLWAAAVEQGTQQFAVERDFLTEAREAALASWQEQGELLAQMQAQQDTLTEQVATLKAALEMAQQARADVEIARAAAAAEAMTLRDTLEQERRGRAQDRAEAHGRLEAVHAAHQTALAEQAQAFRDELNRATERLQHSEAQMLKHVDDARVIQRRAETHLTKVQEQNTGLRTELAELRQRTHGNQQELAAAQQTLTTLRSRLVETEALAADRERALITQTAQAEAAQRVIGTLEAALQRPRRGRLQPSAS